MYNILSRSHYEKAWRKLVDMHPVESHQYLIEHKERHYELFDYMAHFLKGQESPRVVEIGISAFTRLYKKMIPEIRLVTIDRPVELYGTDASYGIEECGAEGHYNIDLNRESIAPVWGEPPLGIFDYVVFCEVLEHLTVNPVQLLKELLSLLSSDGYLYLTTPNFFSLYHLQQMARFEHPQPIFPRRNEDKFASYHFREYSMLELIDFVKQAGGKIIKASYSDCWQDEATKKALETHPELRSNLVIVAALADATVRSEYSPEQIKNPGDIRNLDVLNLTDAQQVAALRGEVARLKTQVAAYENGRFMRLMRWLHQGRASFGTKLKHQ
jgi:SAM-dependent methyltransferase